MTTNIVNSITDEMLDDLEEICRQHAFTCCGNPSIGGEYMGAQEQVCCGQPESTEKDISWPAEEILELVTRLRQSENDAARYRWLRDKAKDCPSQAPAIVMLTEYCQPAFDDVGSAHRSLVHGYHADQAIDDAMENQQ